MKAFIANLSIKTKLLICFTLVSAIPALIIFYSSYNSSVNRSFQIYLSYGRTAVEQTAKLIENYLQGCERCCSYIANDEGFNRILEARDVPLPVDTEKSMNNKLMQIQKNIVPQAYAIYVIGENGYQFKSVSQRFTNNNLREDMLYWKVANSKKVYWDGPRMGSWALGAPVVNYLMVGKALIGADGTVTGAVLIEIPEQVISRMLQNEQTIQTRDETDKNFICLLDRTFKVISHTDSAEVGSQIPKSIVYSQDMEARERNESNYLTVLQPIGDRWMVLGGTHIPELKKSSASLYSITIATFLGALVLAVGLSLILSRFISNPIKHMTKLMQEVERGNLDVQVKLRYNDDIGIMGRVFNNMLKELRLSIARIQENEKRLRILQYDMLKEQIKPHFMYNSLDTVRWLARDGNTREVEVITLALMKFYKLYIGNGSDTVTLSDEMESVRNYLIIQKVRYEGKIRKFDLVLPEEIANCSILRLTLQPLVENAIYHGLKNKQGGGEIRVRAARDADRISISVEDTGKGMTEARLREVMQMLTSDGVASGIGLRNVNARLKLKYGQQYGLTVESVEDQGTIVLVSIPGS